MQPAACGPGQLMLPCRRSASPARGRKLRLHVAWELRYVDRCCIQKGDIRPSRRNKLRRPSAAFWVDLNCSLGLRVNLQAMMPPVVERCGFMFENVVAGSQGAPCRGCISLPARRILDARAGPCLASTNSKSTLELTFGKLFCSQ